MITASISAVSSFAVMMTYFIFAEMRPKKFMQFIFYISLSDFFLSLSSAIGFPSDTTLCFVQGVISSFFAMSSWLWVTCFSFSMFSLLTKGVIYDMKYFHAISWILPLISTFIPLTMATYGQPTPREQWCTFVEDKNTQYWTFDFSTYGLYWGWFFLCVGLMLCWEIIVYIKVRSTTFATNPNPATTDIIKKMYNKVALYPYIIVSCWSVNFIVDEIGTHSSMVAFFSMLIGTLNGFFATILFFWKSDEARGRWYRLIYKHELRMPLISEASILIIDFEDEEVKQQVNARESSLNSFCINRQNDFDGNLLMSSGVDRSSFIV